MGACASLSHTDSPQVTPASIKRFVEYSPEIWRPSRADTPVAFHTGTASLPEDDDILLPNGLCHKDVNAVYWNTTGSKHSQDAETGELDLQDNRISVLSDVSDSTVIEVTNPRNSLVLLEERLALRQEFFRTERHRLSEQIHQAFDNMASTLPSAAEANHPTESPVTTTCNDLNSPSGTSSRTGATMADLHQEVDNMDPVFCNGHSNHDVAHAAESGSTSDVIGTPPICGSPPSQQMNIASGLSESNEEDLPSLTSDQVTETSHAESSQPELASIDHDNHVDKLQPNEPEANIDVSPPEIPIHGKVEGNEAFDEHENADEKLVQESAHVSNTCQGVIEEEGNASPGTVSAPPADVEPGDTMDDDLPIGHVPNVEQNSFVNSCFEEDFELNAASENEEDSTIMNNDQNDSSSDAERQSKLAVEEMSVEDMSAMQDPTGQVDHCESQGETVTEGAKPNLSKEKTDIILQMGKELMEEGIRIQQHLASLKNLKEKKIPGSQESPMNQEASGRSENVDDVPVHVASYERMLKLKEEGDKLRAELEELGKRIPKKVPKVKVEANGSTEMVSTPAQTPAPPQQISPAVGSEEIQDEEYDSDALLEEYNMVTHEDVEDPGPEVTSTEPLHNDPDGSKESGVDADTAKDTYSSLDFGKLKQTLKEWEVMKQEFRAKEENQLSDNSEGKMLAVSGDGHVVMVEQCPDSNGGTIVTPMPNLRGVAKNGEVVILDRETGDKAGEDMKPTGNFMGVNETGEITILEANSQNAKSESTTQSPMLQGGQIVNIKSDEEKNVPGDDGNKSETLDNASPESAPAVDHVNSSSTGDDAAMKYDNANQSNTLVATSDIGAVTEMAHEDFLKAAAPAATVPSGEDTPSGKQTSLKSASTPDDTTKRQSPLTTGNKLKIFRLTMNLQAEMGRMQLAMSELQGQIRSTNAALAELSSLVINEMEDPSNVENE